MGIKSVHIVEDLRDVAEFCRVSLVLSLLHTQRLMHFDGRSSWAIICLLPINSETQNLAVAIAIFAFRTRRRIARLPRSGFSESLLTKRDGARHVREEHDIEEGGGAAARRQSRAYWSARAPAIVQRTPVPLSQTLWTLAA